MSGSPVVRPNGKAYRPGNRSGRRKRDVAEPRGKRWEQARRDCFATWGDVCWLCGHKGAGDVDHFTRVLDHGPDYYAVENLRPAHGTKSRCPVCGHACNQQRSGSNHDGMPVVTPLKIETEMARVAPHHYGCKCRDKLIETGELRNSRCW